jgi:dihydroneopterin aldolase
MQSDRVEDTLSYADVYEEVKEVMKTPSQLLENVAYRIGRQLFKAFPDIESLEIKVAKINPPMATDGGEAAVELQLINDKTR